ncbi:hypothetical protein PGIGA_G00045100 [Pangasianodon gigas]|uniref:Uncharacterized protein n=1 Tax=Pangasianodon gigas TaxID=30993 RepID=A0ACC5X1V9_PANGG|nr:hypothetical protein [Pangasianodon gigas]
MWWYYNRTNHEIGAKYGTTGPIDLKSCTKVSLSKVPSVSMRTVVNLEKHGHHQPINVQQVLDKWNIVADEATSPAIRSSSESSSLSFLRRRCPASSADKGALRFRSMDS